MSRGEDDLAEAVREFLIAEQKASEAHMGWDDRGAHEWGKKRDEAKQRMTILAMGGGNRERVW